MYLEHHQHLLDRYSKCATFALKVSWSELEPKFEEDIDFWPSEFNGQVKMAPLITVHSRERVTIEKWEDQGCQVQRQIVLEENDAQITSFETSFFEVSKRTETDFALSHSDIEQIATQVWTFQFEQ
ncbi:hypothetical protein N7510_002382, partial [Penicillium lagena]|uniref:uncharacterized protein n=1 Tax=Penicillium lagena TaxID=94218 RepID=UPI00253F83AC